MTEHSSADENLRVIRALIERATIYRAISAPSALVAGLLSALMALAIYLNDRTASILGRRIGPREFATIWLIVLAFTLAANTFFIWREAKKSSRPFISSGMKLTLRTIMPNLLIPAAFTGWFFATGYLGGQELDLVVIWIAFYGLALLSTALFAPRSLVLLGWAFLLSALAIPAFLDGLEQLSENLPNSAMGFTFGAYHLIYAICSWPRKRRTMSDQLADE